jgi:homoserine dehydrogenase
MKVIGVGLVGAGTVGGGVVKVLNTQSKFFTEELKLPLLLKRIVDTNAERFTALPVQPHTVCSGKADDILNDPDIQIVVELVGGTGFARTLVVEALKRGKHVVTANKKLLAEYGPEIFAAAAAGGVSVYFEASVGGGIPLIKSLREGMIANDLQSVMTIINGTCNYILTKMAARGRSFDAALKDAQKAGYAEADPTLDVGGGDSGHKVAIMASLAHGCWVPFGSFMIEGIQDITAEDIAFARELGYTIKLLGIINDCPDGRLDVRVHPAMLHNDHILASVNDAFNAVWLQGDAVGSVLLYGRGAGEMPTASAVVADLVDCARDITAGAPRRISMDFYNESHRMAVMPMDEVRTRYYLRFSVHDRPGVLAGITSAFGRNKISIASIVQKEGSAPGHVPVILLTHEAIEKNVRAAVAEIDKMDFVRARTQLIRIEP